MAKAGIDYVGVGVGVVLVDRQGRVFMAQRGPKAKNERGLWEFPGGAVEFGESLEQALAREMKEEYGIDIEVGDLLDVVDHILPDERQHWVSPTFMGKIVAGEPCIKEPEKCSAISWFSLDIVPGQLTRITAVNLMHYRMSSGKPRYRTLKGDP